MALRVGSLFSGVGGMDLGLERAGMRVLWNSEIDPWACGALVKNFPGRINHGDIRQIDFAAVEPVDMLCGGFPCQDISNNGKGAGLDGERSGLWREYVRAIRTLRPRYVLVENVAALLVLNGGRDFGTVLGDLAALGYDAEWSVVSACAMGAPHTRERLFLVAVAGGGAGFDGQREGQQLAQGGDGAGHFRKVWLQPEPCRVAHGTPHIVDRLRGIGNAVVPQIAEMIGGWIVAHAARHATLQKGAA